MFRTAFAIALGLTLHYPLMAGEGQVTLRKECTRDRCVYYKGSTRIFSVEKEYGTARYIVRDGRGSLRAKVKENPNGTVEIEGARRRR